MKLAERAGQEADDHADSHCNQRGADADIERIARAVDGAREDIAAQLVGAEQMLERRALEGLEQVSPSGS